MVIRCERCSTLYELDEGLLSPSGSQVQCTRCQHLFTAYPPRAAGRTLVGVPQVAAGDGDGEGRDAPDAPPAAPALPKARSAPAAHRPTAVRGAAKTEPKPVRTVPAPVYRPATPSAGAQPPPGVSRAPVLRRDAVGAFEARLRRSARMRWLAPVLAGAAIVVLAAGWFLLGRRGASPAVDARREALALAALDDAASLDQSIARLEEIERRSPPLRAATADRALVQVLRAGALSDEADALAARMAARAAERDRLRREQPAGWEQPERTASAEVQALEPELRAARERSSALAAAALESLRQVGAEAGETPEVARGLAAYHALAGARDRVEGDARPPRAGARDPWLDLAAAWLDAREPERAARERAVVSLKVLATSHPELLRGRVLLARAQASLGHRSDAIVTLDGVLAANGRHEGARRLREELSAPAPAGPPAVTPSPPPPEKPATHPRKVLSQPLPAAGVAPPEATEPPPAQPPSPDPAVPAAAPSATRTPAEADGAGGPGDPTKAPARRPARTPEDEPVPAVDGG